MIALVATTWALRDTRVKSLYVNTDENTSEFQITESWLNKVNNLTRKPSHAITVGSNECDYTSVNDAVNAASAGDTILIYPGTYAEQININKSDIALVGIDRYKCLIKGKSPDIHLIQIYSRSSAISNITIANLTVDNDLTWGENGTIAQEAIAVGHPDAKANAVTDVVIRDCDLEGYQDTTFVYPNSSAKFINCKITGGFDIGSTWASTAYYINCEFYNKHNPMSGCLYVNGTVHCYNCQFYSEYTGTPSSAVRMVSVDSTLYFMGNQMDGNFTEDVRFFVPGGTAYLGGNYLANPSATCSIASTSMVTSSINCGGSFDASGAAEIGGDITIHGEFIMDSDHGSAQATITQNTATDNEDVLTLNAHVTEGATWGADALFIKQEGIGAGATCKGNAIRYDLKEYGGRQRTRFKVDKDGDVYLYDSNGAEKVEMLTASGNVNSAGIINSDGGYKVDGSAVVSGDGEHIMKVYGAGTIPAASASHYGKVIVEQQTSGHDRLLICLRRWNGSGYDYAWAAMPAIWTDSSQETEGHEG